MGITTRSRPTGDDDGGLTVGVTPIDMAHAYETIAHGGRRVTERWPKTKLPWESRKSKRGSAAA